MIENRLQTVFASRADGNVRGQLMQALEPLARNVVHDIKTMGTTRREQTAAASAAAAAAAAAASAAAAAASALAAAAAAATPPSTPSLQQQQQSNKAVVGAVSTPLPPAKQLPVPAPRTAAASTARPATPQPVPATPAMAAATKSATIAVATRRGGDEDVSDVSSVHTSDLSDSECVSGGFCDLYFPLSADFVIVVVYVDNRLY